MFMYIVYNIYYIFIKYTYININVKMLYAGMYPSFEQENNLVIAIALTIK